MFRIMLFGKQDCAKCESAKKKLSYFLAKWGMKNEVGLEFQDMDTVDGLAEGSFHDVIEVPVTFIKRDGQQVARWDGVVPDSREVRLWLEGRAAATQD